LLLVGVAAVKALVGALVDAASTRFRMSLAERHQRQVGTVRVGSGRGASTNPKSRRDGGSSLIGT